MSLITAISPAHTTHPESGINDPNTWLVDAIMGPRTASGERVTPEGAMALSAYFASIRVIAEDVAQLPLPTYERQKPRGKNRLHEHPADRLLNLTPNPEMTAMSFRETLTAHALGWGNGYAEIERATDGTPLALWPIHPSRVAIKRRKKDRSLFYEVKTDDIQGIASAKAVPFDPHDILHIHGLGPDGIQGWSVARVGAESIGKQIALQKFEAAFFRNGTTLSGVLTHPETLSDGALKHLRESWTEIHSGLATNRHKIAILEQGLDWKQTSVSPQDAQMIQSGEFGVEDVCRWFRVAPHKIGHLKRSTFNNIESQQIDHVVSTLGPWLRRWEQEADRKLIHDHEQPRLFCEHLVLAYLRGDQKSRAEYYSKQFHIGGLTQNDIAEAENRNGIGPEGDVTYVSRNLVPTHLASQGLQAPANEPAPQPKRDREHEDAADIQAIGAATADLIGLQIEWAVRKEAAAITRAIARHDVKTTDGARSFNLWTADFYAEHETQIANHAERLCRAVVTQLEATTTLQIAADDRDSMPTSTAKVFAAAWTASATAEISEAIAEGTVEQIPPRWTETKATAQASLLSQMILTEFKR